MAADGFTTIASTFGPRETVDRLEAGIKARGMTLFARIDHAAGAAAIGQPLRLTEVLIFGNAKAGTPLMQADQTVGLDLPLKVLVYEDDLGKTWLTYEDPHRLADRHSFGVGLVPNIDAISAMLGTLTAGAADDKKQ